MYRARIFLADGTIYTYPPDNTYLEALERLTERGTQDVRRAVILQDVYGTYEAVYEKDYRHVALPSSASV